MTTSFPSRRSSLLTWLAVALTVVIAVVGLAAVLGAQRADAATGRHTEKIVRRPVTASGHVAPGYHVVTDHSSAVTCLETSPVAVDKGIAWCGATANYTLACWKAATPHRVLCYSDPFSHTVRSLRLHGRFPHVTPHKHVRPQALALANGQKFLIRGGGAWDSVRQHPTWFGFYLQRSSSHHHGVLDTIYGPGTTPHGGFGDGVNRTHAVWTVVAYHNVNHRGDVRKVDRAYFVGTAH